MNIYAEWAEAAIQRSASLTNAALTTDDRNGVVVIVSEHFERIQQAEQTREELKTTDNVEKEILEKADRSVQQLFQSFHDGVTRILVNKGLSKENAATIGVQIMKARLDTKPASQPI